MCEHPASILHCLEALKLNFIEPLFSLFILSVLSYVEIINVREMLIKENNLSEEL